jgi:hypothetical protein
VGIELLPTSVFDKFEVEETHHAASILYTDFRAEWDDLVGMLSNFVLCKSDILAPGGGRSMISIKIDRYFFERGWNKHKFKIEVSADGVNTLTPTHEVDNYRNRIAIETEWNNKDPFYDRDLTTFRLLFELNVLSIGIIITRAAELQETFRALGKTYGKASTQMDKLLPKLRNRASGGCPILAFGIKNAAYAPDL